MEKQQALTLTSIGDIYALNQRWLINWFNRRIGCPHNAADLAQDTFTRVLNARESLYVSEAKALLTTIAKGLVIDHFRRSALEAAYYEALSQLPEPQTPSPEARLLILETLIEVDRMLDSLPVKVRKVFLLSQLDGLSYADIAARQKISLSSVQKYMAQSYAACYRIMYASQP